jgi:hypothetical protein
MPSFNSLACIERSIWIYLYFRSLNFVECDIVNQGDLNTWKFRSWTEGSNKIYHLYLWGIDYFLWFFRKRDELVQLNKWLAFLCLLRHARVRQGIGQQSRGTRWKRATSRRHGSTREECGAKRRLTGGDAGRGSSARRDDGWLGSSLCVEGDNSGMSPAARHCPVGLGCNQRQEGVRHGAQPLEISAELTGD